MKLYNRFLTAVAKSEVLKTCQLVVAFLKQDQRKDWSLAKLQFDKMRFSRKISDVITKDGQVNVQDKKPNRVFCDKIKDFVGSYASLTSEAITLSREVHLKSQ